MYTGTQTDADSSGLQEVDLPEDEDIGNQDINEEEQDEQSRKEDPTWTPEEADNIYTKTGDDDNEESAKPR